MKRDFTDVRENWKHIYDKYTKYKLNAKKEDNLKNELHFELEHKGEIPKKDIE